MLTVAGMDDRPVSMILGALGTWENAQTLGVLAAVIPEEATAWIVVLLGLGLTALANWRWIEGKMGWGAIVEVKPFHHSGRAMLYVKNVGPTDIFAAQLVAWGKDIAEEASAPRYLQWDDQNGKKREINHGETACLRVAYTETRQLGHIVTPEHPIQEEYSHRVDMYFYVHGDAPVNGSWAYSDPGEFEPKTWNLWVKLTTKEGREHIEDLTLRLISRAKDDPKQRMASIRSPIIWLDKTGSLPEPSGANSEADDAKYFRAEPIEADVEDEIIDSGSYRRWVSIKKNWNVPGNIFVFDDGGQTIRAEVTDPDYWAMVDRDELPPTKHALFRFRFEWEQRATAKGEVKTTHVASEYLDYRPPPARR